MKTLRAGFAALLLLACALTAAGHANTPLVGVWQDAPAMGSGWSNAYQFFSNGTFVFHGSQFDGEKREVSRAGTWRVRENKLYLSVTRRTVIEGGRRKKALGSAGTEYEIVGGIRRVKKVAPPQRSVLPLSAIGKDPANKRLVVRFGKARYWKFGDDPRRYP